MKILLNVYNIFKGKGSTRIIGFSIVIIYVALTGEPAAAAYLWP